MKYSPIANGQTRASNHEDKRAAETELGFEAHLKDNSEVANDKEDLFREEKDEQPPAEKLSPLRRLALVASLLLCVFVIFAFAFLLPCHGVKCKGKGKCKPLSSPSEWTRNINISGFEPAFIKVFGLKNDLSTHILLGYSICEDRSMNECSGGLFGYGGPKVERLWSIPTNSTVSSIVCRYPTSSEYPVCVVSSNQSELYRISIHDGDLKWKVISSGRIKSFDMIKSSDVVLLKSERSGPSKRSLKQPGKEEITIISGESGKMIGSSVSLSVREIDHLITTLAVNNTEFVLVYSHSQSSLVAISVKDLYRKAQGTWNASFATKWGSFSPDPATGLIEVLFNTVPLQKPVLVDLNSDAIKDIVICGKGAENEQVQVMALNGVNLQQLWKVDIPSTSVDKPLVASHFDGDDVPDIAVVLTQNSLFTSFIVLSGVNGSNLWTLSPKSDQSILPTGVPPSLSTSGGFLFWLPKSDLKIIQQSTMNAKGNSANNKNRTRRELNRLQLEKSEREGNVENINNEVQDTVSHFMKNDVLDYNVGLEKEFLYNVFKEQQIQENKELDDKVQKKVPYSRDYFLYKNIKKDFAKELEELPNAIYGRQKRVAPQREKNKQTLVSYGTIPRSLDKSHDHPQDNFSVHKTKNLGASLYKVLDDSQQESVESSPLEQKKPPAISHSRSQQRDHISKASKARLHDDVSLGSHDRFPKETFRKSIREPAMTEEMPLSNKVSRNGCSGKESGTADSLVAVFAHKPHNAPTELDKVLEESSLYLGAEKYYELFGSNPPGGESCIKFIAQIIKEPVLGDLYGNSKVHLVYVVSYIEVIPPSVHVQSRRRIVQLKAAQI